MGTFATEAKDAAGRTAYAAAQSAFVSAAEDLLNRLLRNASNEYLNWEQVFQRDVFVFLLRCSTIVLQHANETIMAAGGGTPDASMYSQRPEEASE
jgi:hypothetical protein